jgi:hypothetical protein
MNVQNFYRHVDTACTVHRMMNGFADQLYSFTCTKYILHILTILQHVSAHHNCRHQGVIVVVISIDSEVKTSITTALWQYQLSKPKALWQYQLPKLSSF